jgi:hypothetical protein
MNNNGTLWGRETADGLGIRRVLLQSRPNLVYTWCRPLGETDRDTQKMTIENSDAVARDSHGYRLLDNGG